MTVQEYRPSNGQCWPCQIPDTVATYDDKVSSDTLEFPTVNL